MGATIRMLILGTGGMAHTHARAYRSIDGVTVVAGVDTRADVLDQFCQTHDIEHRLTSLDAALEWGEFDAVSNVTPDGAHYATTLALVAAGKHILCEKPLATDFPKAQEMARAVEEAGLVNMVNLRYREVSALQKASEMVAAGDIGTIRHFEASYLQSWLTQPAWGDWTKQDQWLWRLSKSHGSNGVLGDVGIHIVDFATYIAGSLPVNLSCRLKTFHKATNDKIGDYELDANDSFVLHAELENGAIGTITATRFASGHHNDLRLRLYGDKGGLEVQFEKSKSRLFACLEDALVKERWQEVVTDDVPTNYQVFITAIQNNTATSASFRRGADLQQILDIAMASDDQSQSLAVA